MSSRQFAIGRSSPCGSRYASKPEFLYRISSEGTRASSIKPVLIVVNSTFGFFRFAKDFFFHALSIRIGKTNLTRNIHGIIFYRSRKFFKRKGVEAVISIFLIPFILFIHWVNVHLLRHTLLYYFVAFSRPLDFMLSASCDIVGLCLLCIHYTRIRE